VVTGAGILACQTITLLAEIEQCAQLKSSYTIPAAGEAGTEDGTVDGAGEATNAWYKKLLALATLKVFYNCSHCYRRIRG
jgi:hypothetical protein